MVTFGRDTIQDFLIPLLVMTMISSCATAKQGTLMGSIPKEINGWVEDAKARTYDRKTLFQYIDGGAELYLAYGFREARVHTYSKLGEADIILNVFDMGTPEDAYGVFASEREGDDIGIGQESEYEAGLLRFFKGRFFVSITALEETPESKKALFPLARAVADAVLSVGEKPSLLSVLPREGRIERSLRYLYNYSLLNHHYYIADRNILLLDPRTRAALARYVLGEGNTYLLVVQYPSREHTKKAYESFMQAYMPEAVESAVQTENKKWTAVMSLDTLLAMVFDAPSLRSARSLLESVRQRKGASP